MTILYVIGKYTFQVWKEEECVFTRSVVYWIYLFSGDIYIKVLKIKFQWWYHLFLFALMLSNEKWIDIPGCHISQSNHSYTTSVLTINLREKGNAYTVGRNIGTHMHLQWHCKEELGTRTTLNIIMLDLRVSGGGAPLASPGN